MDPENKPARQKSRNGTKTRRITKPDSSRKPVAFSSPDVSVSAHSSSSFGQDSQRPFLRHLGVEVNSFGSSSGTIPGFEWG